MYPVYKNTYKRPFCPNKKALKGEKMKKLLIGLCFLCASTPSMAAGANKMTMVTYFPVKYVAYSQVDVMKQMDVGLTSACQMNLGCSADEGFNTGKSLRVNNLLKIAGGKLELNDAPAIEGSTAHIGSGNGTADFDFETSLRVGNYKQGYTIQTDNMYLSELNLFGYKFPACSGETMSWQKLKLKNKEEVYLVCGEAEQGCTPTRGNSYTEDCPSGQTGSITYTWDEESCSYNKSSTCSVDCTWKRGAWTTRGLMSTDSDTCTAGDTRPYSYRFFDEADENAQIAARRECTDWTMKKGYDGQVIADQVNAHNIKAKVACPSKGLGMNNWGSVFAVYWDKFLAEDMGNYLVDGSKSSMFNCSMGGIRTSPNTIFACNLANGNVAYVCYEAKVSQFSCVRN